MIDRPVRSRYRSPPYRTFQAATMANRYVLLQMSEKSIAIHWNPFSSSFKAPTSKFSALPVLPSATWRLTVGPSQLPAA
jgi:hypothetical protein